MIVNTRRLFLRLLPRMQIGAVCDVGSMNGADALTFRDAVPDSIVYAFEPHPENFRLMEADRALQQGNIHLMPLAATDYDGDAEFFIVEANHSLDSRRHGMSCSTGDPTDEGSPTAVSGSRPRDWIHFLPTNVRPAYDWPCGLMRKARHMK